MFGGRLEIPELLILLVVVVIIVLAIRSRTFAAALLGLFLGAFVGYLLRPSVPILGQLPLHTVITGGNNLSDWQYELRPVAQESRRYMIVGAIVGCVVLGIWGTLGTKRKQLAVKSSSPPSPSPVATMVDGAGGLQLQPAEEISFCSKCGKQLSVEALFCSTCGSKKIA